MRTILINTLLIITMITATTVVIIASYKGHDIKVAFIILGIGFIPGLLLKKKHIDTNAMKWVQTLSFTAIIIYYFFMLYF